MQPRMLPYLETAPSKQALRKQTILTDAAEEELDSYLILLNRSGEL